MKSLLVSLSLLATTLALHAAPTAAPTPTAQLSQFKLGAYIAGPQVTLDNAAGKAVLIDAWGIHCGPCLASLPDIEKIAKRYSSKMLVFGAESQGSKPEDVKPVVAKNKLSYTITQGVSGPIQFSGIPHVFVFDTKGELVFSGHPGDPRFEGAVRKATAGATSSGAAGAKPSGLDALKRPGA
ncbi:MAG: TlpA family protein disulfide reductase [Chthoniobacter sp.]|nr:TlpA family protein disulfide reductase [Chthoniobacter sp.]